MNSGGISLPTLIHLSQGIQGAYSQESEKDTV